MQYQNFTVDFPKRLAELDREFRPIASRADLHVSYVLMKLAGAFLLPYERIEGKSGARSTDIRDRQAIRKILELDKRFHQSAYCSDIRLWSKLNVEDFQRGPQAWRDMEELDLLVHKVLCVFRHSVAHSNLFFGGETKEIEHVFLGNRTERDANTGKYLVIRCSIDELNHFLDAWIFNVQKLRVSPALIWRELEGAA